MKWLSVTHNSRKWNPQWLWYSCIWASPHIFTYILIHWLWKSFSLDFLSLPAFFFFNNKQKYSRFHYQSHLCREHPVWHGVNTTSLNFSGKKETIFNTYFSSSYLLPSLSLLSSFFLSLHSLPLTPPPTLPPLPLEFMFPLKMNFLLSQLIFSDYK